MTQLDNKIIGKSPAAERLKKMIELVAVSHAPAIVLGPTGSGKELVAEAIHELSRRKGNFIAINCAAIPAELMEAEIFGFEKGAFTGAQKTTLGKFELANKGTIFLDEIGDMPLSLQTKLLRMLENSTVTRVGGDKEIKLDVRVVCATHKDLTAMAEEKNFREDLLYRLNVFPIEVPSLTERKSDIPMLLDYFLVKKIKTESSKRPVFDSTAIDALCNYHWPGNIRELRNIIERAVTFFPSQKINNEDVEKYLLKVSRDVIDRTEETTAIWDAFDVLGAEPPITEASDQTSQVPQPDDFSRWFEQNNSVDLRRLLRDIEIVLIKAALDRNDSNTSEAAKDLKLQRTTLIEKAKKYGL